MEARTSRGMGLMSVILPLKCPWCTFKCGAKKLMETHMEDCKHKNKQCPNCGTNVPNVAETVFCGEECVDEYQNKEKN